MTKKKMIRRKRKPVSKFFKQMRGAVEANRQRNVEIFDRWKK